MFNFGISLYNCSFGESWRWLSVRQDLHFKMLIFLNFKLHLLIYCVYMCGMIGALIHCIIWLTPLTVLRCGLVVNVWGLKLCVFHRILSPYSCIWIKLLSEWLDCGLLRVPVSQSALAQVRPWLIPSRRPRWPSALRPWFVENGYE